MSLSDKIDGLFDRLIFGHEEDKAAQSGEDEKSAGRIGIDEQWMRLAEFLGIDSDMPAEARNEATYYTCLKILSEGVGKLPINLMYETEKAGIRQAIEHPLYDTFRTRPNPYMTPTSFWSWVEAQRLHYGNACVYMTGLGTENEPLQLWPMPFPEVEIWYDDTLALSDVPDIYYKWSTGRGLRVLKSYEVMHFRTGDSIDGIIGIPVIDRLRGEVEGALGSQKFQNELITSGMTAKAVLQYTGSLSDDGVKKLAANLEKYARGEFANDGVRNIIPIPVGTQMTPLNLKLTDAQFAELKKYSAVQIASAFGIKPQQIGDMTKQSYASSQAQQEAFYTDTMLYIIKNYEEEIAYKALPKKMRRSNYFFQFDTTVMLRSDFKTQVETYKMAVEGGLYKANEARRKLNLPAADGGDELLGNGNLIPLGMAGQQYVSTEQTEGGE